MQQDDAVLGRNFVHEVGRPQHADALIGDQPSHMTGDFVPRPDVEAYRRLVQEQEPGTVEESPAISTRRI